MSRSNPHENSSPNPAARWFEWNGETGVVRYYDKDTKKNVDLPLPFRFILLDQLGSVGGWHKHSDCRIYSNEVKDTRQDVLVVKTKKDGIIAEGIYKAIAERLAAVDGQFVANLYIAFKQGEQLAIGSLRVKGAALKAWVDFTGKNRDAAWAKAIAITSYTEGQKGKVTFRAPVLEIAELSADTNEKAVALDTQLQAWLKGYFSRTRRDQAEAPPPPSEADADHSQVPPHDDVPPPYYGSPAGMADDDIPF